MENLTSGELSKFLAGMHNSKGILNYIKLVYRPYICPFNELLNLLPEVTSVADIGCGQGQFIKLILNYKSPSKVLGLEISESLLDEAKSLLDKNEDKIVDYKYFNGIQFPDLLKQFNYITLIDVFHHIPKKDRYSFLYNLYSSMSFGSKLIVKDIEGSSLLAIFNKLHDLIIAGKTGNEISSLFMKDMLEQIGFKTILQDSKRLFWYPHYWLVVEK